MVWSDEMIIVHVVSSFIFWNHDKASHFYKSPNFHNWRGLTNTVFLSFFFLYLHAVFELNCGWKIASHTCLWAQVLLVVALKVDGVLFCTWASFVGLLYKYNVSLINIFLKRSLYNKCLTTFYLSMFLRHHYWIYSNYKYAFLWNVHFILV